MGRGGRWFMLIWMICVMGALRGVELIFCFLLFG